MRSLALVLTLLLSGLAQAQTLTPVPPPAGYEFHVIEGPPRQERRWGLFTAGVVTFGVSYLANLQAGIPTGQVYLDVPLIGPLLEISAFTNHSYSSSAFDGWMIFLLVTDATVQMGGLAMTIAGAATKRSRPGPQTIQLVPLGTGAAIRGSF